jgi:hypothetical protein
VTELSGACAWWSATVSFCECNHVPLDRWHSTFIQCHHQYKLTVAGTDTPSANILSIFTRTRSKINIAGGRCPSLRHQLEHQGYATEIWRSLYPPGQSSSESVGPVQRRAYSGSDIFCRFVKKSLFRIVEADSMLPERFVTMLVTSSGSAMPSARSTCLSGFKPSMPSANSSFSNVLITNNAHEQMNTRQLKLATYLADSSRRPQKSGTYAEYRALWIANMPGKR